MIDPDFWKDADRAKKISQDLKALKDRYLAWESLQKEAEEIFELSEVADDEKMEEEIKKKTEELEKAYKKLEFQIFFDKKYDKENAILSIHAGTGGTDAEDWTEMLLRMYLRFSEKKGWAAKIIDENHGGEAGIKNVTLEISGQMVYGWLKSESGVHRLVRISPFDAEKMRHTSFALVEVLPELDDISEIELDQKDLRIDTFLSSGHGGQSVQTTYSAVRVVHLPTGITVSCQNERSQSQNKDVALKILKTKLLRLKEETQEKEIGKLKAGVKAAWGNQIRSYVLQPYKMVKDHRTKYETANADAVLDGELSEFMEEYLRWQAGKEKS
jgi:peptide chain release factor 2